MFATCGPTALGPAAGATFTLSLPLLAIQPLPGYPFIAAEGPRGVPADTLADSKVLVVEDQGESRELVAAVLAQHFGSMDRLLAADLKALAADPGEPCPPLRGETTADVEIDAGPEEVLSWLEEVFDRLLAEAGKSKSQVVGIGIGLPGPVDFVRGMAVNPPIMAGWHEYPVADRFRQRYEVPVLVDNDVNIMALGEQFVMSPAVDDFIFLKVGKGIGSGLILGGRLHRGAHGAAGDIGHVQAAPEEVVCRCGNNGCLEASAGGAALAEALSSKHPGTRGSRDVVRLVKKGDNDAIRAVRSAGRLIGRVLASTVNLLNPSLIMVGGDMAAAEQQLLAGIREVVYRRSTTLSTTDLRITTSTLGDRAGVTGAAAMVIDHVLRPETVEEKVAALGGRLG